jgi:MFS family permease
MLANLFGLALAGGVSDERGPQPVLAAGLACFALGLVVAGTATSMTTVVVGRAIQGLGAGSIGASAYVVIGRAFAPDERARMFALLSAAWVVPALVAPAAAGAIAEHLSWRWVFLGLLPFPAVAAVLALPPLAALKPVGPPVAGHAALLARARAALQLVAATILFLVGLGSSQLVIGLPVAVLGAALGVAPLRRLLPPGSLRAAGVLPAVIAVRALLNWSFFGTDSFVPLAVTAVRGYTTTFAGLVLTSATLAWSGAAWLQARRAAIWGDRRAVRASLVLVGAGIALVALSLDVDVPIAVVFVGWTLGGAGMGIGFNVTSVIALGEAPAGEEGAISASLQLADALGIALSTGIGGSIVAAGARNDWADAPTLLAVFAVSGVAVIPAFFAAGRLRARPGAAVASARTG